MNRPSYEELDPGIRDVVRMLNDNGIETCDSGDGVSKSDMGCALDVAHVFAHADKVGLDGVIEAFGLAHRMRDLLGPGWDLQLAYTPKDDLSVVMAFAQAETSTEEMINAAGGEA